MSEAVSTARSAATTASPAPVSYRSDISMNFPRVTEQDRFLAMLGKADLNMRIEDDGTGGTRTVYREEFCGACGIIHSRPELLDMYAECKSCHNIIREPSNLRKRYLDFPAAMPLDILFATYGDPYDPDYAEVVTHRVIELVQKSLESDRIAFKPKDRAGIIFDCDPCPGKNKQLRIRYRVDGVHATMVLDFDRNGRIPAPFLLMAPRRRYLKVFNAIYGHPKGSTVTGRMSYDVTELIQSLVDQTGGSFLAISSYTPLRRIFGDPCPDYPKDLRIQFEVSGKAGSVKYSEIRGHLKKRIFIQCSPTIAPLIFVSSATYGLTPTARRDRLDMLNKKLKDIRKIEHRVREGMVVQPDEIVLLRSKKHVLAQKELFQNLPTVFIDVSVKLQRLADEGGVEMLLDKEKFDPNFVFGNPTPGVPKILEVALDCQGHDSERLAETNEMMDTGYSRNFITSKKARFNIIVLDENLVNGEDGDPYGFAAALTGKGLDGANGIKYRRKSQSIVPKTAAPALYDNSGKGWHDGSHKEQPGSYIRGLMVESLYFRTDNASPIIIVTRATYGEIDANDVTKIIDVTLDMQAQVVGRTLTVEREVNLNKLFRRDPSPGKRKQLKISYMTRGFTGNLRVREKNDCLVAGIELGYPPVPPPDDDDFIIN